MQLISSNYNEMRNVAAQLYFNWFSSKGIIDNFNKPETIESICYHMGYSQEYNSLLEKLLEYLSVFNILTHAGGTYSLNMSLEKTKSRWASKFEIPPNHPIVPFLCKGLKLLSDRLEGGSGEWDSHSDHFLTERAFSNEAWHFDHPDTFAHRKLNSSFDNLNIGIYGRFPQNLLGYILEYFSQYNSLKLLVPDESAKKQVISYCELLPKYNGLSPHVEIIDKIVNMKFDTLIVVNGLFYKHSIKAQMGQFDNLVRKNGSLFLPDPDVKYISGLEPLLFMDSQYPDIEDYGKYGKSLRVSSFGNGQKHNADSPFIQYRKE